MKKVILDTNFVMLPFQFNIDIFTEIQRIMPYPYRIYVLEGTVNELNRIIDTARGKHKSNAKAALDMIEKKKIKHIQSTGRVDDFLVAQDAIVATQDKILIQRLKAAKKQVIQLRQKQYLILK